MYPDELQVDHVLQYLGDLPLRPVRLADNVGCVDGVTKRFDEL